MLLIVISLNKDYFFAETKSKLNYTQVTDLQTELTFPVHEYNSLKSCCPLRLIRTDLKSVLKNIVKVISFKANNTTLYLYFDGHFLDEENMFEGEFKFKSKDDLESSNLQSVRREIFVETKCQIKLSYNDTEGIYGKSFIPTFDGEVISVNLFSNGISEVKLSSVDDQQVIPVNRIKNKKKRQRKRKRINLVTRSILYIKCKE